MKLNMKMYTNWFIYMYLISALLIVDKRKTEHNIKIYQRFCIEVAMQSQSSVIDQL